MMGAHFREPQLRAALEIPLRRSRRADRSRQDEPRQALGRPAELDPGPGAPGAESVPAALLPGHVPLRAADAAVLPFPADRTVAGARADGSLHPPHGLRFSPREGPAVREADPLRGGAAPVSADIRLAQAASAETRSRDLPPGAAGDPVRAGAPARGRIRAAHHRRVSRPARGELQPFFLSFQREARAYREFGKAQP